MRTEQLGENMETNLQETLKDIMEELEEIEKSERKRKVRDSTYTKNYKSIMTEEIPKYLKGRMKMEDRSRIAKFRCGNETRGGQY